MLKLFIILFFPFFIFAENLKIASYNVENFFDLNHDESEYTEFIPNNRSFWNEKNFNIKLNNLIKVIEDLDADIIALQEIENKELMLLLQKNLPKYKYYSFLKYPESAVGLGILSKIEIKETKNLDIKFRTKRYRPILENSFIYENVEFKIFNNHWPSKSVGESYRIKYAKGLQDRLNLLPKDYDYILLGDFNSDYNEFQTFKNSHILNNTRDITGINNILNSTINEKFITYDDILKEEKKVHYNLWLEIPVNERFSAKFRNQNSTPDNILIPSALFDNKKISYIPNSFKVFKPEYLYENNEINRWEMIDNDTYKIHKGDGFSNHLPIFAFFSVKKEDRNILKQIEEKKEEVSKISDLYKEEKLKNPILFENVVVIYKDENNAVIKKENDKAIFIYKNAKDLKEGFSYNLQINQIQNFNDIKEIKDFVIIDELKEIKNYKNLYLNGSKIDIFNFSNTNEIITNLKGVVKNTRLYINENQYIKLYSKTRELLPKSGDTITILSGRLTSYKGNMQIVIQKSSDYKVGN